MKRFLAMLSAALLILMYPASVSAAGEAESDEPTGYWKFDYDEVSGPDSNFDDAEMSGGRGAYYCHAECHDDNIRGYHGQEEQSSCAGEYIDISISVTEPSRTTLTPGETLKFTVDASVSGSAYHDSLLFYECKLRCDLGHGGNGNSEATFKNSEGENYLGISRSWESNGDYGYEGSLFVDITDNVVSAVIPDNKRGDVLWITQSFGHGRGEDAITTTYYYKWVDLAAASAVASGEESEEESWTDVYDSWKEQSEHVSAPDEAGSFSTNIDDDIVDRPDHSDGGRNIAIPLGLATIGGIIYVVTRVKKKGKKDKSGKSSEEKKEDKKKKTPGMYRMVFYKKFGGQLRIGGTNQVVGARIEEVKLVFNGPNEVTRRDDLTAKIRVQAVENLEVASAGMSGGYMNAELKVPQSAAAAAAENKKAVVEFRFTGEGGSIRSKVSFGILGEPEIVFMDVSSGSEIDSLDCMIDDEEGDAILVGLKRFIEKPDGLVIKGTNVTGRYEYTGMDSMQETFVYKVWVKNNLQLLSSLGEWPVTQELTVSAAGHHGESAEGSLTIKLWPEGMFFDTRKVKDEQWQKGGSILIDTRDDGLSNTAEYYLPSTVLETGVACKDQVGKTIVDRPNQFHGKHYLRIQPRDEKSWKVLNPEASLIWYELKFEPQPTYGTDKRLGSLTLSPLLPLVTKDGSAVYHGSIQLEYENAWKTYKGAVLFDFKGLSEEQNDADRATEVKRIYKLLNVMRMEDMTRIDGILRKYGAEAEKDYMRFGGQKEQNALAQTEQQLLHTLQDIESVHRIRLIRKMVYETAASVCAEDFDYHQIIAEEFDKRYKVASTARWVADIAFTVWWYLMFKENGAAIEPFMTPIKDIFLKYVEQLGDLYRWEKGTVETDIRKYFTLKDLADTMMDNLESSLVSVIVANITGGAWAKATKAQIMRFIGFTASFVFVKNCYRNNKYDRATGKYSVDFWAAFKETSKDLTIDTLKAIVSIVFAKIFDPKRAEKTQINIFEKTTKDNLLAMMRQGPLYKEARPIWKNLYYYTLNQNRSALSQYGSALTKISFTSAYKLIYKGTAENKSKLIETFSYMLETVTGNLVGLGKDYMEETYDIDAALSRIEAQLDAWAAQIASIEIPVEVPSENGEASTETRTVSIPLPAAVIVYTDLAFQKLGIVMDYVKLPTFNEECPYVSLKEMIDIMKDIPNFASEIEFLETGKAGPAKNEPYGRPSDRPTVDIGTDFHKYER